LYQTVVVDGGSEIKRRKMKLFFCAMCDVSSSLLFNWGSTVLLYDLDASANKSV